MWKCPPTIWVKRALHSGSKTVPLVFPQLHEVELAFDSGESFGRNPTFRIAKYVWTRVSFRFGGFIVFEFEKDGDQDFDESQVEVGTTDEVKER